MTWDGASPTFRPPSHDLVCEPDGIPADGLEARGGTPYAWPSRPPPCPGCVSLEAQMAAVVKRATEAEQQSAELLVKVQELQAELEQLGPLRNLDPAMRYRL